MLCELCGAEGAHALCANLDNVNLRWKCSTCLGALRPGDREELEGRLGEGGQGWLEERDTGSEEEEEEKEEEGVISEAAVFEKCFASADDRMWSAVTKCWRVGVEKLDLEDKRINIGNRNMALELVKERIDGVMELKRRREERQEEEEEEEEETEDLLKCDLCSFRCLGSAGLSRHGRLHDPGRPFACDQCGLRFLKPGHVTVHERTHTGERPFRCDLCGSDFAEAWRLQLHMAKHDERRRHACDQCSLRFRTRLTLKVHVKKQHGDLKEVAGAATLVLPIISSVSSLLVENQEVISSQSDQEQELLKPFKLKLKPSRNWSEEDERGEGSKRKKIQDDSEESSDGGHDLIPTAADENPKSASPVQSRNKTVMKFTCNQCGFKSHHKTNLVRHKEQEHLGNDGLLSDVEPNSHGQCHSDQDQGDLSASDQDFSCVDLPALESSEDDSEPINSRLLRLERKSPMAQIVDRISTSSKSSLERMSTSSRLDQKNKSSRLDQKSKSLRLDRISTSSRLDRKSTSSRADRISTSSRVDHKSTSARLDQISTSSRIDRQSTSSNLDQISTSSSAEQNTRNSRLDRLSTSSDESLPVPSPFTLKKKIVLLKASGSQSKITQAKTEDVRKGRGRPPNKKGQEKHTEVERTRGRPPKKQDDMDKEDESYLRATGRPAKRKSQESICNDYQDTCASKTPGGAKTVKNRAPTVAKRKTSVVVGRKSPSVAKSKPSSTFKGKREYWVVVEGIRNPVRVVEDIVEPKVEIKEEPQDDIQQPKEDLFSEEEAEVSSLDLHWTSMDEDDTEDEDEGFMITSFCKVGVERLAVNHQEKCFMKSFLDGSKTKVEGRTGAQKNSMSYEDSFLANEVTLMTEASEEETEEEQEQQEEVVANSSKKITSGLGFFMLDDGDESENDEVVRNSAKGRWKTKAALKQHEEPGFVTSSLPSCLVGERLGASQEGVQMESNCQEEVTKGAVKEKEAVVNDFQVDFDLIESRHAEFCLADVCDTVEELGCGTEEELGGSSADLAILELASPSSKSRNQSFLIDSQFKVEHGLAHSFPVGDN